MRERGKFFTNLFEALNEEKFRVRKGGVSGKELFLQPDGSWGEWKTAKKFDGQDAADEAGQNAGVGDNYGLFPVSGSRSESLDENVTCKRCGGKGTVQKRTDKYLTLDNCPTCKGKGFLESVLTESFNINGFIKAYIECALWSSTDESDESGGEPMDKNYGPEDIASETVSEMKHDCEDFVRHNEKDLDESGLTYERAGHDFWLNRNGHGAGFWDEGDDPVFERLSKASKVYGTYDLYVGDDGKIYGS